MGPKHCHHYWNRKTGNNMFALEKAHKQGLQILQYHKPRTQLPPTYDPTHHKTVRGEWLELLFHSYQIQRTYPAVTVRVHRGKNRVIQNSFLRLQCKPLLPLILRPFHKVESRCGFYSSLFSYRD